MLASSGRAQLAYDSSGVDGGADVLLITPASTIGAAGSTSSSASVQGGGGGGGGSPSHRCVAYDTRGYGETTYEREDGWSPVADAVAVLDAAAGLQRPIVVACSMGGQTAIDLALRPSRPRGRAAADRHRHTRRAVPRPHRGAHGRAERADRGRRRRRRPGGGRPARRMDVARRPRRAGGARQRARA